MQDSQLVKFFVTKNKKATGVWPLLGWCLVSFTTGKKIVSCFVDKDNCIFPFNDSSSFDDVSPHVCMSAMIPYALWWSDMLHDIDKTAQSNEQPCLRI